MVGKMERIVYLNIGLELPLIGLYNGEEKTDNPSCIQRKAIETSPQSIPLKIVISSIRKQMRVCVLSRS
jgi:hypothetical protein